MVTWNEFVDAAPRVSEVFARRHKATGNLCMLATIRADGSPRISPMEPNIFEDQLVMVGMPNTSKFRDLGRDPRFCLHTATVDPQLAEGDAKLWGTVVNLQDDGFHQRFAENLVAHGGPDIREEKFDPFYVADITSASSLTFDGKKLTVTIWKPGKGERDEELS